MLKYIVKIYKEAIKAVKNILIGKNSKNNETAIETVIIP